MNGLLEILRQEILVKKTLQIVVMQDCIWERQLKKLRYYILCPLKFPKNRGKNNFTEFQKNPRSLLAKNIS